MEKGDERIGRQLSRQLNANWLEYWDFLESYADFHTQSGVQLLENYFRKKFVHLICLVVLIQKVI